MKQLITLSALCFSFLSFGQISQGKEYANYAIDGTSYKININPEVQASMNAGSFVLLGAPELGKNGAGLTIMAPAAEKGEWELTGGNTAPMVNIALDISTGYNIKEGKLVIMRVQDKWFEGYFTGKAAEMSTPETLVNVSGKFCIELDM